MATIYDGGYGDYRAMAYNSAPSRIMEEIRTTTGQAASRLSSSARERYDHIKSITQTFDFDSAKRRIKAAMRRTNNLWVSDMIQPLETVEQFQHAPARMLKYIMSEPETRERFYKNRCDGYSDRYVDPYPNRIADDDPIYRQTMNNMWQEDEEGNLFATNYWADEEVDMLEDLPFEDKVSILTSWDRLKCIMAKMEDDPTSPYNAKL